jgi:CIC family chloride channel protein
VLLGLLAAKVLATSLTMWIGGSGGVFAPSLFMGAMLGSAYGIVVHALVPDLATAPGAYGLVGMGAVFAAAARAPITGLIIIFELTGNYRIILPLMCAIVVATALSNAISKDTIYTLKLRRRGISIDNQSTPSRMAQITVAQAMGQAPGPVDSDQSLRAVIQRLATDKSDSLPVTNSNGTLVGTVTATDVEQAIDHDSDEPANVATLVHPTPPLHPQDTLEDAVHALGGNDIEGVPVSDEHGQLIGWITHRRVLNAYLDRYGNGEAPSVPTR